LKLKTAVFKKYASGGIIKLLLTPFIAFSSLVIIIIAVSSNPGETLYFFFTSPFSNMFFFGNMLNYASLLIISAFGISLVFKAGMFNLGGEGQIYAGVLAATAASLTLSGASPLLAVPAAAAAGSLAGGSMGAVSGYLKMKWNTNDLITSFLLSSAVIHIVNYLITGPMGDPDSYLITTKEIPENLRFNQLLPPSRFNISFIFAVALALIYFIYLYRTASGLKLRTSGKSRLFAIYSGVRTEYYVFIPFMVSGILNGLTGSFAALGTYYMCAYNCTGGIGWSAIAVSLIGKNHPLLIIPSALFIAYLESGLSGIALYTGFPFELGPILQAFVFFFITARFFTGEGISDRRYS
jgi:riboflavin transport system permease protein